ncbi:MAG: hypothetical protein COT74_04035 [Bdellovibrionales bacterium CG10_big_fil_rev_8_21_14_0_10_45_34]|nr:MAG: hypothetical protein COT74_04035 [Bdellovibrionales bacterium CG10_big_fil_rev_8_21_14_0_10_45_34]
MSHTYIALIAGVALITLWPQRWSLKDAIPTIFLSAVSLSIILEGVELYRTWAELKGWKVEMTIYKAAALFTALFLSSGLLKDRYGYRRQFLPFVLIMLLLTLQAIETQDVLILTMLLPASYFFGHLAPHLAKKMPLAPKKIVGWGLMAGVVALMCVIASLQYHFATGESVFGAAPSLQPGEMLVYSTLLWLAVSFMLIARFPFSPIMKDFEEVNSWSLMGYIRALLTLIGFSLISRVLEYYSTPGPFEGMQEAVRLFVFGSLSMMAVLEIFSSKHIYTRLFAWFTLTLTINILAHSPLLKLDAVFRAIVLIEGVLALCLIIFVFKRSSLSLNISPDRLSQKIQSWHLFPRILLGSAVLGLFPVATELGLQLVGRYFEAYKAPLWQPVQLSVLSPSLLVALVLAFVFMALFKSLYDLFRLNAREASDTLSEKWQPSFLECAGYVAFIVLGICAAPLYNYLSSHPT